MRLEPEQELAALANKGLLRKLRALPASGGVIKIEDREYLNFSSNDYLNLAGDSRVKNASSKAVERYGCGATASRLMSGHLDLNEELEQELAQMCGMESALVFGSGFLANLGVLTALAGKGDVVFCDRLNHASLIDGMRLSGSKWHRYDHKDTVYLERLLKKNATETGRNIIVSDSIFSMDGDIAPLEKLHKLSQQYEVLLVIDEAHAFGIMGEDGGGICRTKGIEIKPDIVLATMSKALGNYGGIALCSRSVRELLINRARSFIYSTGLPPACLGGSLEAVSIIRNDSTLGPQLLERSRFLHGLLLDKGLSLPEFESQILPVHIGDNEKALKMSEALWDDGIIATAIRPPTVPSGTARLRLSVTLSHTEEHLQNAATSIARVAGEVGVL